MKRTDSITADSVRVLASLDQRWIRAASVELAKGLLALLNTIKKLHSGWHFKILIPWLEIKGAPDLSQLVASGSEFAQVYVQKSPDSSKLEELVMVDPAQVGIEAQGRLREGASLDLSDNTFLIILANAKSFASGGVYTDWLSPSQERLILQAKTYKGVLVGVGWDLQFSELSPKERGRLISIDFFLSESGFRTL
jgi:hypothetical protein